MIEIYVRNARVLNNTYSYIFQSTMKTEDSVFITFLKFILVVQQLYSGRINFVK